MENTSQITVLIGFAEAMSAPEVAWSLVDHGFRVIAFARKGRRSALRHSKHVKCFEVAAPEDDVPATISELSVLVSRLSETCPTVVFPLDDMALWASCRLPAQENVILAGPALANSDIALDKARQLQAAAEAGFAVPQTTICRTPAELHSITATFPLIVKPSHATWQDGQRLDKGGFWICANASEFQAAANKWSGRVPLLVQPFVTGVGEGIFGLATGDGVRAWSAHRRLRMMNPHGSGSSACVSQPVQDDLRRAAERFVQSTGWKGLFMIELLRDSSGTAWFVEFNARPWGSMALSRRQGLEYPAWNVHLTLDPSSPAGKEQRSGLQPLVCRHLGRELMHLLFVLKGPKSSALHEWPSFWRTIPKVLRLKSAEYFYNWRRDDATVFASDCYLTLHSNIFKRRGPE